MIRLIIATFLIADHWTIAQSRLSVVVFPQRASLPENHCDLLTIRQVFAATGALEWSRCGGYQGTDEIVEH